MDTVVVAGDVTIDWLEISKPPVNHGSNWQSYVGTHLIARPGGALLLAEFLRSVTDIKVLAPELANIETVPSQTVVHSFAYLQKLPYSRDNKDKNNTVFRVKQYKGYAGPSQGAPACLSVNDEDPRAQLVVLDDAGNEFRSTKEAWPQALREGNKPIIIIKMSRPIAQGLLWEELQQYHSDRLIVVINAEHLRREGVSISRRLSWERTAKDFVWQMACNKDLINLHNCAHLIVRFGVDGVILHTRRQGLVESRLFFDPKMGEDAFGDAHPGNMIGTGTAFVAALTAQIASEGIPGVGEGIRQGIISARRLWEYGFGRDLENIDYPVTQIFKPVPRDQSSIAEVIIPNPTAAEPADPDYWCILNDQKQAAIEELAFDYVRYGPDQALTSVPVGQFRYLRTFDRSEIESFRSIRNLIKEYLSSPKVSRPLSIAVFGSPGSGKSFGVTEVAESVAPGQLHRIEFNLSQFNSEKDLISAFHSVRDILLEGKVPIVFFDEFDSAFNGKLGWLKYFLAPMQDGKFRDGEAMHPIGKAIFVFAGGTCSTFHEFSGSKINYQDNQEAPNAAAREEFRSAKGTDFVSRLRGYVNIKGPNPLDANDDLYMIRRALNLRFIMEDNAGHLFDRNVLRIDQGVLRAMIKIREFKHGIRSMLAIVEMSMLTGLDRYEQTALPSAEQLELHVDSDMFLRLVVRDVLLGGANEEIARGLQEDYREKQKDRKPADDPAMAPWEDLRDNLKDSNRHQASHMVVKLKAVGYGISPVINRAPNIVAFTDKEIEIMSEMEHDRWNQERYLDGWSYGESRDLDKKISPYLVKWEELPEDIKEYDREFVRSIPHILAKSGFEIYRLK
jgi:hypothetical protein